MVICAKDYFQSERDQILFVRDEPKVKTCLFRQLERDYRKLTRRGNPCTPLIATKCRVKTCTLKIRSSILILWIHLRTGFCQLNMETKLVILGLGRLRKEFKANLDYMTRCAKYTLCVCQTVINNILYFKPKIGQTKLQPIKI